MFNVDLFTAMDCTKGDLLQSLRVARTFGGFEQLNNALIVLGALVHVNPAEASALTIKLAGAPNKVDEALIDAIEKWVMATARGQIETEAGLDNNEALIVEQMQEDLTGAREINEQFVEKELDRIIGTSLATPQGAD
jgi:hypothetical protein